MNTTTNTTSAAEVTQIMNDLVSNCLSMTADELAVAQRAFMSIERSNWTADAVTMGNVLHSQLCKLIDQKRAVERCGQR